MLHPDVFSSVVGFLEPAPLQALRSCCRLFRTSVTDAHRKESVEKAVALYTRATVYPTDRFIETRFRLHSQLGQHVAFLRVRTVANRLGENALLCLDGRDFVGLFGFFAYNADDDFVELRRDFPETAQRVWISRVRSLRMPPVESVRFRINVDRGAAGVWHVDCEFFVGGYTP
jgi:hypothetical protein